MLIQHIALVPEAEGIDASELARVSAALQKQMLRDLAPIWGITATIDAFPRLEDVPSGSLPVILTWLDLHTQEGVHLDRSGQPYAQIRIGKNWSLAASRACLEMLVNPFEARTAIAASLRSDQGLVEFLIEACGPVEAAHNAYAIDGVAVSDFCTPAFYDQSTAPGERYSFRRTANAPLQVQPGGHATWYDPISGSYWLRNHWSDNPTDTKLGSVDRRLGSVRELVNACAPLRREAELRLTSAIELRADHALKASQFRAHRLRAMLGTQLDPSPAPYTVAAAVPLPPPPGSAPAPAPTPAAALDDDETLIDIEDEFEELETFTGWVHDDPERHAEPTTPSPAPSLAPAPSPTPRKPARPRSIPSLSPISIAASPARTPSRARGPVVGALTVAAVVGLVWIGRSVNPPPARVTATSLPAATTPAAAPKPEPAPAAPPPPAPDAKPPAVATPAADPAATAAAATPDPAADAPKKPTPVLVAKRKPAADRTTSTDAPARTPVIDPPAPPATRADKPARIDDLFETRQ